MLKMDFLVDKNNTRGYNVISASVFYTKGRGYSLYLMPMKKERRDGFVCETYEPFSGKSVFLMECKRRSAKRDELADSTAMAIIDEYLKEVCENEGLVLC